MFDLVSFSQKLLSLGHFQNLQPQSIEEGLGILERVEGLGCLLKVVPRKYVFFKTSAKTGPDWSFARLRAMAGEQKCFKNQQGWDTHENRSVSALNLFVEGRHISASLLEQLTELV